MCIERAACAAALLSAIVAGCANGQPAASTSDASSPSSTVRAGTLSVTALRFTGWHDESFHYLPSLSVTAPATGLPVVVERVDFTADDAGSRRLLKGVRYPAAPRVQPGGTVELVSDANTADPAEISSPLALESISAIVFFTDDQGQTGIVSASAPVSAVSRDTSVATLEIRQFTVERRASQGRFHYWPKLTLAETSGRSHASIRKMLFDLPDVGAAGQVQPVWSAPDIAAGDTITLITGKDGQSPWFEIDSSGDASRVTVKISFVDEAGRGGVVSAVAPVASSDVLAR